MSVIYITLDRAKNIIRDDNGVATSWQGGKKIASFTSVDDFADYVDENIKDLKDAVAFTGSYTILTACNNYIAKKLKELK